MSFQNLYYKRTTGTPKACLICYKPTTTVLATINTTDFFYTCTTHLTDRGFATKAVDEEPKQSAATAEEIARVKEEWEEKMRRKEQRAKEKENAAEKDGDAKEGQDKEEKGKKESDKKTEKDHDQKGSQSLTGSSGNATQQPTHERYVLHRDMFSLRQAEHRRRRQAAQAKELAPRLPGVPRGL